MAGAQTRIQQLEARVAELIGERDELYKDIENLCMQGDDSFWSASSVLSARIGSAERSLGALTLENTRLKAQRDSMREDLAQFRSAKRDSDKISKEEMEKNRVLDRELMFYKKQCERALEDRNLFAFEVEELKSANLDLERGLADARGRAQADVAQREDGARRLARAEGRVAELEERLVEVARIPELEKMLAESRGEAERLKGEVASLRVELDRAWGELESEREEVGRLRDEREGLAREVEAAKGEAEAAMEAEAAKVAEMERKIASLAAQLEATSGELHEADSAMAAAQAQVELISSEHETEISHLRQEYSSTIMDLEGRINTTENLLQSQAAELQDVTQAKVEALIKLSEWQAKATQNEQRVGELEAELGKVDVREAGAKQTPPPPAGQEDSGPRSWFNWQQGKQTGGANMPRNVETHV